MTQLELFAGIGGFGLAGHWAGIETVCQVEIDPFCQKVLAKNFPNAKRYDDIKTFDGTQWRGVDIISGGFPCQPYSSAGKRLGTEDERHLWPEMLRVIREAQPRWVVGENVGGLISWSDGLVFEQVCVDLEAEGYEVQPFVLPACAVNAPHRRDRVWFVAKNTNRFRRDSKQPKGESSFRQQRKSCAGVDVRFSATSNACKTGQHAGHVEQITNKPGQPCGRADAQDAANAKSAGCEGQGKFIGIIKSDKAKSTTLCTCAGGGCGNGENGKPNWDLWTPQPPIRRMDDGIPGWMDGYWDKRVKALGNAIVPQVAYQIFKSIIEYENLQK